MSWLPESLRNLAGHLRRATDLVTDAIEEAVDSTAIYDPTPTADESDLAPAAEQYRQQEVPLGQLGPWRKDVDAWVEAQSEDAKVAWRALMAHASRAAGKARPSDRWRRQAADLLDAVGAEAFGERLGPWTVSARLGSTSAQRWDPKAEVGISDADQDMLKGLLWCAAARPELAAVVVAFGRRCYRKIPNFGASSTRLGNACVWSLGAMDGIAGVGGLSELASSVRYASAKRLIQAALDRVAEATGMEQADLEESAVPTYQLGADASKLVALGAHGARITLDADGKVALQFVRPDGEVRKTVAKETRAQFGPELKAVRAEAKALGKAVTAQLRRIEGHWLTGRELALADFEVRYLQHPVVAPIARRLIWRVAAADESCHDLLMCLPGGRGHGRIGGLRTIAGAAPAAALRDPTARVRLWHPLDEEADPELVLVWRDRLEELGVEQPLQQVWRGVFGTSGATAATTARFAGRIVRQHILRELCSQRGWAYQLQGYWDSANSPRRDLAEYGSVELEVDPLAHDRDEVGFTYLLTRAVRFSRPIAALPAVVYSEVLREVDLIVSMSSVAAEADFDEDGFRSGWWSTGDDITLALDLVAAERAPLVQRVLERTALRGRSSVGERGGPEACWLTVDQSVRVHLGSGRIEDARGVRVAAPKLSPAARRDASRAFLPLEADGDLIRIVATALALGA